MPQAARNITTDGQMTIGDGQKLFDAVPSARKHYQHHKHHDNRRDGLRMQLARDDQELHERNSESKAEEARLARDYAKMGTPFTTNAEGKRVPTDWSAPFRTERAQRIAAIEANAFARKKIGANVSEELRTFSAATRGEWREVEMPTVADDRNPKEIIREREGRLKEIDAEEIGVQNANRMDAEIEKIIRADYLRRRKLGAPKFGDVMRGGSIRYNGQFTPANPNARLQYPTAAATVQADKPIFVEFEDGLNFRFWEDDDGSLLAKLLKAARAANAGKRQISEADKTKMLREIAVRKLAAQRHLEASYRHAEAQGVEIKRRELPPQVLLWLEFDTAPTKLQPLAEEAHESDFEGDE